MVGGEGEFELKFEEEGVKQTNLGVVCGGTYPRQEEV